MLSNHLMYTDVMHLLKTALPPYCHYHNYEHTIYVWNKVALIAAHENCSEDDLELLKAAALWHDTGFVTTYEHHEEESCRMAAKYLAEHQFSQEYIQAVCGMIMATQLPQLPKTRLEEIVADADLEYLGTPYAALIAENLFKEWQQIDPSMTRRQWNDIQISFLQKHHYFTDYCKINNGPLKDAYLQSLLNEL